MLDLGGHRAVHLTFMHDIKGKLQITEVCMGRGLQIVTTGV